MGGSRPNRDIFQLLDEIVPGSSRPSRQGIGQECFATDREREPLVSGSSRDVARGGRASVKSEKKQMVELEISEFNESATDEEGNEDEDKHEYGDEDDGESEDYDENDDEDDEEDDEEGDEGDDEADDEEDDDMNTDEDEDDEEDVEQIGLNSFRSRDGRQWSPNPPVNDQRGRQPRHNIVRETAGPRKDVSESAVTPLGALLCFLTVEIMSIIVKHTNQEGRRVMHEQWVDTTVDELQTFIGLLILAGVYRGRREPIIHLWNQERGRPTFSLAMARNRFQQITRALRFDSRETRLERRQRDKMAPIRDIHDKLAARCRASYKPGTQLCVDEQLVVFRGRCPFKVYIPSKPGRYGMKVWMCCDVETSYVCNFELYTGKTGRTPEKDQAMRVVLQMMSPFQGSGRGCTGDNFFTSDALACALLQRLLSYCGTVRKNRRFLPPALLNVKSRQVNSSVFAFFDHMTLVSYIPKKGKNVILLSTQHHNGEVHNERQDKKPEIILHYNRTKGAVDTLDQMVRTYSCQRKSRRWPMVFFQNLIDIAALNAYVVFSSVNTDYNIGKPQRRRLFLEELALDMISKGIADRQGARTRQPLPTPIPPRVFPRAASEDRKRVRCERCPRTVDRKTSDHCDICDTALCKEHSRIICYPSC